MNKARIYCDHASSSSPKAPPVLDAMSSYFRAGGYNIGRGHYEGAEDIAFSVLRTRRALAKYFGSDHYRHLIFTANVTEALNLVLKGVFRPGWHVLLSSLEHNAVMRPMTQLLRAGVRFDAVCCREDGRLDPERLEAMIRPETRAVVLTAASNVCGTVLPLKEVGEICRRHDLFFIIDSAQAAGLLPLEINLLGADAICFTGHKSLLGPPGIGGVLFSERLAALCEPLISGGTGSFSDSEELPLHLPDRFEAGTQNLPGILGLGASLSWLESQDKQRILCHELALTARFLRGAELLPHTRILGLGADAARLDLERLQSGDARDFAVWPKRLAVVSLDFPTRDNAAAAFALEQNSGILTRCGLHCAPRAHRSLGSFPAGSVRFSFGHSNTEAEIDQVLAALGEWLR